MRVDTMPRKYTNALLELIDEGLVDRDMVIMAFCKYCSEDEVRDMMLTNGFLFELEDAE